MHLSRSRYHRAMRLRMMCAIAFAAIAAVVPAIAAPPKIAVQIASATTVGEVSVRVTNAGEEPSGKFNLELTATAGSDVAARAQFPQDSLEPHESRVVSWTSGVADGTYIVRARATSGTTLLEEKMVAMRVGAAPQKDTPENGGRGLIAGAAIVVVLAGGILWPVLRRRRLTRTAKR